MPERLDSAAAIARLKQLGVAADAAFLQRYFRTGPGEYGEGDRFLGVRVPVLRRLAAEYRALPLPEAERLLRSEWHEARLLALLLLVRQFERGEPAVRKRVYDVYLAHTRFINNWDLVDVSAGRIVGGWLRERSRAPLRKLARSRLLWERRIAIVATQPFIRAGDVVDTLELAGLLLHDEHDLIHKAVGWMLREAWKVAPDQVARFVESERAVMPRTMLRYAIEKQPEAERQRLLRTRP